MPTREILTEEIINKCIKSLKSTLDDINSNPSESACTLLIIRLYEILLYYCSFYSKVNTKGTANYIYINEYMGNGKYKYLLYARDLVVHNFYDADIKDTLNTVFIKNESSTRWILTELHLDSSRLDNIIEFIKNGESNKFSVLKSFIN